jgi:hypothetical protein
MSGPRGTSSATLWWLGHVRGRLKFTDGSTRDLDIGILIGNYLLVVEAKARAATRDLLIVGDEDALARRWEWDIKPDMSTVDNLAASLAAAPRGRNYAIPENVSELIPLICGPLPEWIPEIDKKWWLYEDIPRVSTPDELIEVIDRILRGDPPAQNRIRMSLV